MRKTSEEFNFDTVIKNIAFLCKEPDRKELLYWETINNYLKKIEPEQLQEVLWKLGKRLLRCRAFEHAKIRGNYWEILIDGTQIASSRKKLDGKSLYKIHQKGREKEYKVFLFDGKEDVLKKVMVRIGEEYPKRNIVDSYSPPFGFEKNKEQLRAANERIKISGADILIVFLGCPKQEKFIDKNKEKFCVPISITMGGCVDFIAGGVSRALQWMQNVGLEWLYRFLQEPKRMFRRYFIDDIRIFGLARKYREKY